MRAIKHFIEIQTGASQRRVASTLTKGGAFHPDIMKEAEVYDKDLHAILMKIDGANRELDAYLIARAKG